MHLAMQHAGRDRSHRGGPMRRQAVLCGLLAGLLTGPALALAVAIDRADPAVASPSVAATTDHPADRTGVLVLVIVVLVATVGSGMLLASWRRRAAIADESSKAAARMLAFASHEIRNPVHGIAGLAELLERSPLDAEQRRVVATIRETAFGLGRLADDFLQHARLRLQQLPPRAEPTSPARLVDSVLQLQRSAADRKRIRLEAQIDDAVQPWVLVDAGRIRQVLLNLVSNAVRHSAAGHVSIRVAPAARAPGRLRFEVRDAGRGLSPDERERLFQPFAHDAGTARPADAVGIGLSISRELIESLGGTIGIDPQTLRGSCFWFEVDAPPCAPPDPGAGRTGQPLPALEAFVVDDDPVSLEVTLSQLAQLGVRARGSNDPVEVTAALGGDQCDVVLLDYQMPGLDGLSLARRLRGGGAAARPRLLIVSGEDRARLTDPGIERVIDGWLLKPVSLAELEAALRRLFGAAPTADADRVPPASDALIDEATIAELAALRIDGQPADRVLAARVVRAIDRQLGPIGDAIAATDTAAAARLAHRLRGAVAPLGCRRLAARLASLEDRLRQADPDGARRALAESREVAAETRALLIARYDLVPASEVAGEAPS
jgi:two-component system sensor histidine kinase EvgS